MTETTSPEDEIKAMTNVANALQGLDPEATKRVLKWAHDRYQLRLAPAPSSSQPSETEGAPAIFTNVHDLFDAANPTSGPTRVLVLAYWFQIVQKQSDLDSQEVNTILKDLGHRSKNITRDFDGLIGRAPSLMMQVKKQGTTRQARKRYRLTREGVRMVQRLLHGQDETSEAEQV